MTTKDEIIEQAARIIDTNAFTRYVTHEGMIKRQKIARRKAAEILSMLCDAAREGTNERG
ncbi:hypothetical protein NLM33_18875 [Bradyrhizobium sp. CCGUVB1N3]|uniref:hypothetical protein n=1 Tax=Bradyrhizobium sp. CCGUVB1N3 TaxID=2949629 RepID=UPI0020B325F7|nr:hypothetical protein [Bradyrhizobium sp. CCGUVB1N3]MCP3471442.1 hypothetical protein [Bradyrhizobium sp. CCGUVB1N3]MCP3472382.1 hypothetical protein [Bradyrhizobium sp. CCGUVB1N3]